MTTESKRILYIVPRFHPFKGGAEQNMFAFASRMAADGHDIHVYTSDFPFRDEKLESHEVYKEMHINRMKSFFQRPAYLWFAPGLLTRLLQEEFDVIHVSGFGFIWVEFCLMLRKLFKRDGAKYINTPHGPFMAFQQNNGSFRAFAKKLYDRILKLVLPKIYDKVIAVVNKQLEWLHKSYGFAGKRVEVIPNGIDATYLEATVPQFEQDDKVLITFTGRMEWYKGIQDVISAIAGLKGAHNLPEYEFKIMGRPDKFTPVLKKQIEKEGLEDKIKLVYGPTDDQRDQNYLDSQIFILPSKWEATGIVLIEAMAKGNVLISTNQNDAVDIIIEEGKTGFSYDFGDVEALTELLKELLKDFELRQKIIHHNVGYAKHFTWDAVYPLYQELIEEI